MGKSVKIVGKNTPEPWVDADGDRWLVVMTWAELDGRAECIGIEIRSFAAVGQDPGAAVGQGETVKPIRPRDSIRPVRGGALRRFGMSQVDDARRRWAELLGAAGPFGPPTRGTKRAQDAAAFSADGRGRRLVGADGQLLSADEALAEVARVYKAAWVGENPTAAVARELHLSESAAAKRVARAREKGLLPPTTRGRAAGSIDDNGER